MTKPGRDELGPLVAKVHRPTRSTARLLLGAAAAYASIALAVVFGPVGEESSSLQVAESLLAGAAAIGLVLALISWQGSVKIHERGMESAGNRMLWDKMAGYRLGWNLLGAKTVLLVEQTTQRELSMRLDVFRSAAFRDAAGRHTNLDKLVKMGTP